MGLITSPYPSLPAAKAAGYTKVVPTGLFVIARITAEDFAEQLISLMLFLENYRQSFANFAYSPSEPYGKISYIFFEINLS